jgi:hypothetical protein
MTVAIPGYLLGTWKADSVADKVSISMEIEAVLQN